MTDSKGNVIQNGDRVIIEVINSQAGLTQENKYLRIPYTYTGTFFQPKFATWQLAPGIKMQLKMVTEESYNRAKGSEFGELYIENV